MKSCPHCQRTYPDEIEFCSRDGSPLSSTESATEMQLAEGLARRFHILRRLGAGGMGTVFLAEQIGVGSRPVALKVLSRRLLDDPDFLLRFQNEAASTGRIDHPNVVTIYESAQADDGTPYIAMQYLQGETLRDALKRRGALPVAECSEILQQTARGLNAAHKLGIIHRDLKPDNIFLTRGDESELVVKIVDFGIAKLRESATHTQTGMVLGTPAYMSSEQASGMRSDQLDARSDLYSLGIVVYEMLTGRVPFHSDTPLGYLRKHMLEPPPPMRAVAPGLGVSPPVEAVVMKALAKDREERYASALEFAREFARAASAQAAPEQLRPTVKAPVSPDILQAERERLAQEKAEAERRAQEKAEAERAARGEAEQRRLAQERAEAERRAAEKAEAERQVREQAEQERLAREKAEAERRAAEKAAAVRAAVAPTPVPERPGTTPAAVTGASAPAATREGVAAQPVPRKPHLSRRKWLSIAGCLVLLIVAAVAGCWLWWGPSLGLERTLLGHWWAVYSVAFSPDGKLLASGSWDHTIKLWNLPSGTLRQTLAWHEAGVRSVAFSPDGTVLASGGEDSTVRLGDVASGRLRQTLLGHTHFVTSVTFSPDGKLLASGSWDHTIKLWNMPSGTLQQTVTGHAHAVDFVTFSPDGSLLASGSDDNTIKLWDVPSETLRQTLRGHTRPVFSVAFSPDGKLLASGSLDDTVKLWEVASGTLRQTLNNAGFQLAFSPDGRLLASGRYDSTIKLWDVASGTLTKTLRGGSRWVVRRRQGELEAYIMSLAFSPDGKLLASGRGDTTIQLWHVPE